MLLKYFTYFYFHVMVVILIITRLNWFIICMLNDIHLFIYFFFILNALNWEQKLCQNIGKLKCRNLITCIRFTIQCISSKRFLFYYFTTNFTVGPHLLETDFIAIRHSKLPSQIILHCIKIHKHVCVCEHFNEWTYPGMGSITDGKQ